jgi:hypothetical protein
MSPWHIIIKTSTENRERILKAVREKKNKKQITFKSKTIKMISDFSAETFFFA